MTDALTFLKTRRSRPEKILGGPYPDDTTLTALLEIAARTTDHGKLVPWRFIVLKQPALRRLAGLAIKLSTDAGRSDADTQKCAAQFQSSGLAVAVIESPKPSEKIPAIEMTYSTGAVCLGLVNAALASGWGASWLSGWAAHQPEFGQTGLGLAAYERIAGIIHIGTPRQTPPDRDRPVIADITHWIDT